MKVRFEYQYKTSDGVRHCGTCRAASEQDVYGSLRAQGIKAYNVRLAPGLLNKIMSFGGRWFAIAALVLVVLGLAYAVYLRNGAISKLETSRYAPMPRHHVYGDPAYMERLKNTMFEELFPDPGERLLACYAQPGTVVPSPFLSYTPNGGMQLPDFSATLANEISIGDEESREAVELKRIVIWMKEELRTYLSDGVGTSAKFVRRLNERQREELEILSRVKCQLRENPTPSMLDRANQSLRTVGLPTISQEDESGRLENGGLGVGKKVFGAGLTAGRTF